LRCPSLPPSTPGSTTFFYPLEIIMSNSTQPAGALQHQPVQQQNAAAPGPDVEHGDELAAARLTAIRIRGQHADLDADESAP
jgi:hypothetical protein